tara:strand:- start:2778 stop:3659 length:882 start_codon:yes stop_codon:yes gene_type:complete
MKKINKVLLELYSNRKQVLFLSFLGCISYLIEGLMPSDPNVIQASGLVVGIIGGVTAIGGTIMSGISNQKAMDAAAQNQKMVSQQAQQALAFQVEQQKKLDAQKDIYRAMEFKNPYTNMENAYEDLTVNQQQARFQAEQGQQQRANIMQRLKGVAGGSGIAGLAQAMASQGQLATQQASASIGMQEQRNQMLRAQGAQAIDLQERGGEAMVQTMEMDRQATLLGVSMAGSAGANAAAMQAQQNQIAAGAAEANLYGQQAANFAGLAATGLGMVASGISAGQDPTVPPPVDPIP